MSLALGSVAFANDKPEIKVTGGTPASDWSSSITWTLTNQNYKPQNSSNTQLEEIRLIFNGNANNSSALWKGTKESTVAAQIGGKSATKFELDFKNHGLELSGGDHSLGYRFNSQTSKTINVTNLKDLQADLNIADSGGNNTSNTTLDKMMGDVIIAGSKFSKNHTITFKGEGLKGNIISKGDVSGPVAATGANPGADTYIGRLNVTFKDNAKMTGNITSSFSGLDGVAKVVTFEGSDTVLTGNIISYGSMVKKGLSTNGENQVEFKKGNMKGSIIATEGTGNNSDRKGWKGYNKITFSSGRDQTLEGGILANGATKDSSGYWSNRGSARNTLIITSGTTLTIKGNGTEQETKDSSQKQGNSGEVTYTDDQLKFQVAQGSITSKDLGSNDVILEDKSTLKFEGGGFFKVASTNDARASAITFQKSCDFYGQVKTESGRVNLNFGTSADSDFNATIHGDVTSNSGTTTNVDIGKSASKTTTQNTTATIDGKLDLKGTLNIKAHSSSTLKITQGNLNIQGNGDIKINKGADTIIDNIITTANSSGNKTEFTIGSNLDSNTPESQESTLTLNHNITANNTNDKITLYGTGSKNATLILKGTENKIKTLQVTTTGTGALVLDSSKGDQVTDINTLSGNNSNKTANIKVNFQGDHTSTLNISNNLSFSNGTMNINFLSNGVLNLLDTNKTLTASSSAKNTINIGGENTNTQDSINAIINGNIKTSIASNSPSTKINFLSNSNTLTINGKLESTGNTANASDKGNIVSFNGSGNILNLNGIKTPDVTKANTNVAHTIDKLSSSGSNNTINLSGQSYGNGTTPKLLLIEKASKP